MTWRSTLSPVRRVETSCKLQINFHTIQELQRRIVASCLLTPGGVPCCGVSSVLCDKAGASTGDEDIIATTVVCSRLHRITFMTALTPTFPLTLNTATAINVRPPAPTVIMQHNMGRIVIGTGIRATHVTTAAGIHVTVSTLTAVPNPVPIVIAIRPIPTQPSVLTRISNAIVIGINGHPAAASTGTIGSPAMVITTICCVSASFGGGPVASVQVGGVAVSVVPTSGGDGGRRAPDEMAAATTTGSIATVTAPRPVPPTMHSSPLNPLARGIPVLPPALLIDISDGMDGVDDNSSLLPSGATPKSSDDSISAAGGRDCHSGESHGTRRFCSRSPPPTTVTADGAAKHHVGHPAAWADALAIVTLPRPAPAGLLSTSSRPQPGRETQRSVRVGIASRVAGMNAKPVGAERQTKGGIDDEEEQANVVGNAAADAGGSASAVGRRAGAAECSGSHSVLASTRRHFPRPGVHGSIAAIASARPPVGPCPHTWVRRPFSQLWPPPDAPHGRIFAPT